MIRVDSGSSQVDTEQGVVRCTLRGRLARSRRTMVHLVAVGDQVELVPGTDADGVIEAILPRRTKLSRRAAGPRQHEQVVAANVDLILIVASFAEPTLNLDLVDRYLVAADQGGLAAVICVNKLDLAGRAKHAGELDAYQELGYAVVRTSAQSGIGIDLLRERLRGHTAVLAGPSGVGKSTLINAIQPGLELRTAPVSNRSGEGRHTTTASQLMPLAGGGYVIDTPGIREYTLWEIEPEQLDRLFPDLDAFREACRFGDCTHSHEPDCAIKDAVEAGEIIERRYASYLRMLEEVREEAQQRATPLGRPLPERTKPGGPMPG